ncbi:MAG: hypothetical protein M1838_004934 [Thelocarpon superellum]|nr:MAG: hypothetical protein M1838_004934 [Thelocarpon superellum]
MSDHMIGMASNHYGGFGSNSMLRLSGTVEPYQYAGILNRGCVNPQAGLASPATVVSYLLPSGRNKVTLVRPGDSNGENVRRLQDAGGVGVDGTVDPAVDYAYAPLFRVALGLAARYPDSKDSMVFGDRYGLSGTNGPFVTADKADGSCVVIDFRNMPAYLLQIEGHPAAQVCEFNSNT